MKQELAAEGTALSKQRRAAAGRLRIAVESCLADLAMAGSRFDVRIGWEPSPKVPPVLCVLSFCVQAAQGQVWRKRSNGGVKVLLIFTWRGMLAP